MAATTAIARLIRFIWRAPFPPVLSPTGARRFSCRAWFGAGLANAALYEKRCWRESRTTRRQCTFVGFPGGISGLDTEVITPTTARAQCREEVCTIDTYE